jgi:RNA polymerase sigma-70 factor (ECF subfamily)
MDEDFRLVRAMARRDRSAWDAMYDRHVADVFGVIYHLVGRDRHVAEEINQQVWLMALERIDRFDPAKGAFRDWLLGIARHRALRHYRRPTVQAVPVPLEGLAADPPRLEQLDGKERADVVRAALLCLNDGCRSVLLAKYTDGLSVSEIATQTGRSAKGVESHLSRARAQLRTLLQSYFSPPTGG